LLPFDDLKLTYIRYFVKQKITEKRYFLELPSAANRIWQLMQIMHQFERQPATKSDEKTMIYGIFCHNSGHTSQPATFAYLKYATVKPPNHHTTPRYPQRKTRALGCAENRAYPPTSTGHIKRREINELCGISE
jgi:hypothetical protein